MPYIIERDSAELGRQDERVFVVDLDDSIPGYSDECGFKVYSSTTDPRKATTFTRREEAEAMIGSGKWKGGNPTVVEQP